MNKAILSDEYPFLAARLREAGFEIVSSCTDGTLIPYEQRHADMQVMILDDRAFVAGGCERLEEHLEAYQVIKCSELSRDYPHNIALNALYLHRTLIGNLAYTDPGIRAYAEQKGVRMISVRQGYTRCSCAVVGENAFITADKGIYHTLIGERGHNLDVLLIREGDIRLSAQQDGFIGGAGGYHAHTWYVCGSLQNHPDCVKIREFCRKHGTKIIELYDGELLDIGGIVFC